MLRWLESRVLWGVLLIGGGLLFLLQNLKILPPMGGLFIALIFALGGVFFLGVFAQSRDNWWALIPAFALLGIAATIGSNSLVRNLPDEIGGALVIGSLALSFLLIYLFSRQNWWALIPAGVLATITLMIVVGDRLPDFAVVALFFLGLGATFALVAVVPNPQGQMRWAFIPAGILGGMGLIFATASSLQLAGIVWPLAVIALGVFFILRAIGERKG